MRVHRIEQASLRFFQAGQNSSQSEKRKTTASAPTRTEKCRESHAPAAVPPMRKTSGTA